MGFSECLFVDQEAIRTLKCSLCHEVMQDAVQTPCGHSFCQQCIVNALSSKEEGGGEGSEPEKKKGECPVCQKTLQRDCNTNEKTLNLGDRGMFKEDLERREAIGELSIRCRHSGCSWAGELRMYARHTGEECGFVNVRCPNYPCPVVSLRRLMPQHMATCDYKSLVCQYCKASVPVAEQQTHLSSCPEYHCPCGFYGFGCRDIVKRKDMADHLRRSNEKHLMLVIAKSLGTLQIERQKMHEQQREIAKLTNEHEQQNKMLASQRKELEELRRTVATYLQRSIPRAPS